MENTFKMIPINRLEMNDYNIRRFEDNMTPQRQARFDELTESIRSVGILEPLIVRPNGFDKFEIIAGERRYRSAKTVAADDAAYEVPCMIRDVNEVDAFDLMLVENLQRDDLTPFETATAFREYMTRHANTTGAVSDLSLRTGIPVHAIRRMVRLLDLPSEVLSAWRDGILSQSHAELFTRVGDSGQISELLALCLRMKLSTRDLAERIGAIACELDRGFFDKTDCQTCPDNTSVQSGLFSDIVPAGKCGNPKCFEEKQAAFLTAYWSHSKAAKMFGTCGFRFGHRLEPEHRELRDNEQVADRCLDCDAFISVLRTTGAVVSGYSRTCVGPRPCFDALYREEPAPEPDTKETIEEPSGQDPPAGETSPPPTAAAPTKTAPKPAAAAKLEPKKPAATDSGPVYDAARGERARRAFIKDRLMNTGAETISYRLGLLALTLYSASARNYMCDLLGLGNGAVATKIAEAIFEIPGDDLYSTMRCAATASIIADPTPDVWQFAADRFGIELEHDWAFTETYLSGLNKSEIVRIGEEPGVGIWTDGKAIEYREQHHHGKALMALKKEELIDIIINSGAELIGRVPQEIIGKRA
jgi:ParB/RepB/Spo0J family partition protein